MHTAVRHGHTGEKVVLGTGRPFGKFAMALKLLAVMLTEHAVRFLLWLPVLTGGFVVGQTRGGPSCSY
jgi:hypothetical protein